MTEEPKPWERFITTDQLLDLYQEAMKRGGRVSAPQPGCLEACIGNAWTAETYQLDEEDEPFGMLFAAYLMIYLVRNHCFEDGNKRIGWSSLVGVLDQHRLLVDAPEDEVVQLVHDVVEKKTEVAGVLMWLADHLMEATLH